MHKQPVKFRDRLCVHSTAITKTISCLENQIKMRFDLTWPDRPYGFFFVDLLLSLVCTDLASFLSIFISDALTITGLCLSRETPPDKGRQVQIESCCCGPSGRRCQTQLTWEKVDDSNRSAARTTIKVTNDLNFLRMRKYLGGGRWAGERKQGRPPRILNFRVQWRWELN